MKSIFFKQALILIVGGILIAGTAQATKISFKATDIADFVSGQDTWQYEYFVTDNHFDINEGFTIWFDYGLYDDITPGRYSSDWDVESWDPDFIFGVPDDGAYDALSLVEGASLADIFTVSFTWLGGTDGPGLQQFDIYDFSYNILESGVTSPVPEPGTILLMSIGLVGLVGALRSKKERAN